jgi:hypothetical protein
MHSFAERRLVCFYCLRYNLCCAGSLSSSVKGLLEAMQNNLLRAATERLRLNTSTVVNFADLERQAHLSKLETTLSDTNAAALNVSPFFIAPWYDDAAAESHVKKSTSFSLRCYPVDDWMNEESHQTSLPHLARVPPESRCFFSGKPATHLALFARAF